MVTAIDIKKLREEADKSMEAAFERWKETIKTGSAFWTTTGTSATGEFYIAPTSTSEFISMSMVVDEKWIGTTIEAKPEPVTPAKPIKRYSKKEFKKKLKELCG